MTGRRGRALLVSGLALIAAGLAVFAWERQQSMEADIELISLPLFLLGLFLVVEGYLTRRKERLTGGVPK